MRPFSDLQARLAHEVAEHPHLSAIQGYNRAMVGELAKACDLKNKSLLDLGASVHGFALAAALEAGVATYEGIDFDLTRHWGTPSVEFAGPAAGQVGRMQQMNAEALAFPDECFDCLLTISTFEHFLRPDAVLNEMCRVLRRGGVALVSFEPVWTAFYGHHLHHFGTLSELVPPWSHLLLTEEEMRAMLRRQPWPADAPIDPEAALRWIYHGDGINRFSLGELKTYFAESPLEIVWMQPLADDRTERLAPVAHYLARLLPYTADDLLTLGLSLLLRKR